MAPPLDRTAQVDDEGTDPCTLKVVDAQIVKGGIYVYVRAELDPGRHWMRVRNLAGFGFYDERHQDCPVEMQSADGSPIRLLPQLKRSFSLAIVDFEPPPTYSLRDGSILQVFVFRTKSEITPGWYDLRLGDAWESGAWWTKTCQRSSATWSRIFVDADPPDLTSGALRSGCARTDSTQALAESID